MVADKGFHVDGWEEVWEYEDPEKPGLWKIYDPSVWNVDLNKIKLTGYHWNNMWEEDDGPTTGYMMANAGYNVRVISGVIKILNQSGHGGINAPPLHFQNSSKELFHVDSE